MHLISADSMQTQTEYKYLSDSSLILAHKLVRNFSPRSNPSDFNRTLLKEEEKKKEKEEKNRADKLVSVKL